MPMCDNGRLISLFTLTNVPLPGTRYKRPSCAKRRMTERTVIRLRPYSRLSSFSDGIRESSVQSPLVIFSRTISSSCA